LPASVVVRLRSSAGLRAGFGLPFALAFAFGFGVPFWLGFDFGLAAAGLSGRVRSRSRADSSRVGM
jgi:hypothetical protein